MDYQHVNTVAPNWLALVLMPALFCVFFVTKLFGYVDVPIIASLAIIVIALPTVMASKIDRSVQFYFVVLCLFSCYALLISASHSAQEVIFALKFLRTLLLFSLLYFVWQVFSKHYTYEQFLKYFVVMAVGHAVIVLLCIGSSEFRDSVYSLTGYVPRGPGWIRSPGLTVSYNAPTILHVLALWIVASRTYWPVIVRTTIAAVLIVSLVFMGRTIAFLGLAMILSYLLLISGRFLRSIVAVSLVVLVVTALPDEEVLKTVLSDELYTSVKHFFDPIANFGSVGGADTYFGRKLASHVYFSSDPSTLVFGNSLAGHIGLLDSVGETGSDMGVINSINANGMIVTGLMYLFYLLMFWQTRHGDWRTISFVVVLSLMLSFKETGFFTSHATPVLFFLFFFNISVLATAKEEKRLLRQ